MATPNGQPPPLRPRQLLCHLVDERAQTQPNAVYSEIPYSASNYDGGFRKVTYANFANAINGLAHWIKSTLGQGENFDTLAYIGPNDLRYNIVLLAAVKAGYKVRKIGVRNSLFRQGANNGTCRCCSHLHETVSQLITICLRVLIAKLCSQQVLNRLESQRSSSYATFSHLKYQTLMTCLTNLIRISRTKRPTKSISWSHWSRSIHQDPPAYQRPYFGTMNLLKATLIGLRYRPQMALHLTLTDGLGKPVL